MSWMWESDTCSVLSMPTVSAKMKAVERKRENTEANAEGPEPPPNPHPEGGDHAFLVAVFQDAVQVLQGRVHLPEALFVLAVVRGV